MSSSHKLRNIGIAAHIDAGKTTVTERILFFTGVTRKLGEVHDGQATMDFMKEEQARGITIASASISCRWGDHDLNIIDTPGHVDFTVEVERSLRVIDGMLAVFCAVAGVEPQSETVWNQADRYNVPRLALVNKMDREGADFAACIKALDEQLNARPIALQYPNGAGADFIGTIDLIGQRAEVATEDGPADRSVCETVPLADLPVDLRDRATQARREMIEGLSEFDDELMDKYLNDADIAPEILWRAARKGVVRSLYTPVLCGAAYKNKGIPFLLDAVCHLLPSPLDAGTIVGSDVDDSSKAITRRPVASDPLSALAFKAIHDPFVGQQIFTRIYSGTLKKGQTVHNATKGGKERIGRILLIEAKKRHEVAEARPGDIVALVGLKSTTTGDTLCDRSAPLLLEKIHVPCTVISTAIRAASRTEDEALGKAVRNLSLEDPSLTFHTDEETNEMIISGMGELHLEVVVQRLRDFGVAVITSPPTVAYRETITRPIEINHRLVKQTGGLGQFAHIVMRVEPNVGKGFDFESVVVGGRIPRQFIRAIRSGCEDAMARGVVAGYPVVDARVVVIDGSAHDVDSSDMAFRRCAAQAFAEAVGKASPQLLEPTMKVEIASPDAYLGDILADLGGRRSQVLGMRRFRKGSQKISARSPLVEMFGYATTLRSLSSGRANCSMEFQAYLPMPKALADEIIAKAKARKG